MAVIPSTVAITELSVHIDESEQTLEVSGAKATSFASETIPACPRAELASAASSLVLTKPAKRK